MGFVGMDRFMGREGRMDGLEGAVEVRRWGVGMGGMDAGRGCGEGRIRAFTQSSTPDLRAHLATNLPSPQPGSFHHWGGGGALPHPHKGQVWFPQ